MSDYTKIEAWRFADDFAVAIYEATRAFPRLIQSVEKDAGKIARFAAAVTSLLVLRFIRVSSVSAGSG
jgi:hypothetical protein